jgi:hypothetical protein
MAERGIGPLRRHRFLGLVCVGVLVGLAPVIGALPAGAASTTSSSGPQAATASSASSTTTTTVLTVALWQQRYEHDIGILADDVLVVVDDGKRAQSHVTKAEVKTTVNDCRTWASDAAKARTAAPPIPMTDAERAWTSMIGTSALGAADCLAALQHGSRRAAKDFQKQILAMQKDESTLTNELGGS